MEMIKPQLIKCFQRKFFARLTKSIWRYRQLQSLFGQAQWGPPARSFRESSWWTFSFKGGQLPTLTVTLHLDGMESHLGHVLSGCIYKDVSREVKLTWKNSPWMWPWHSTVWGLRLNKKRMESWDAGFTYRSGLMVASVIVNYNLTWCVQGP